MAIFTVTIAQTASPNHYAVAVEKQSFDGQYTPASVIVTLSVALALYNSLEMILLISMTFKRWRGLYFWSLTLCNFGVFAYTTGMMLGFFDLCILWLSKTWLDVGWVCMIVCQSLVLYSRLGLILDNVKILMGVKWMIVVNSLILLIPTVILDFGSTYSGLPSFSEAYYYMEHIQMTGVTLQELIISSLYLWKTTNLLKVISKANSRSMIWQLLTINIIIICMDVALIILEYKHLQLYQESIKAFVYSVKLKLELNILSRLVNLVHGDGINRSMTLDMIDPTTLSGHARSEIRAEVVGHERVVASLASDEKVSGRQLEAGQATSHRYGAPLSIPSGDSDQISPVLSRESNWTTRTNRRVSDDLYADALRNLK
ncbi:hypothetical protein H2202_007039 [Exophiala xenobiotica]|nr:hypothetical protein H2202_007039 [Exophiala xenobiotica]KAK5200441.1 hypothetical protein LTR92_000984 [Exophiala xenobiotica]KAK5206353.1 hypothetical protein LTR41_007791 [Exophiala xenobiotica]KAK5217573.1 hypothetical protein LTR72_009690 [Exophiala xenobiotica]KAK5232922.1 hypothetical protein LTR47_006149 [Exophiala xenobiotica]